MSIHLDWVRGDSDDPFAPTRGMRPCVGGASPLPPSWYLRVMEDVSYQRTAPGLDQIKVDQNENVGGDTDPAITEKRLSKLRAAWNWLWLCVTRILEENKAYDEAKRGHKPKFPTCRLRPDNGPDRFHKALLEGIYKSDPPVLAMFDRRHGGMASVKGGRIMVMNISGESPWSSGSGAGQAATLARMLLHEVGHHSAVNPGYPALGSSQPLESAMTPHQRFGEGASLLFRRLQACCGWPPVWEPSDPFDNEEGAGSTDTDSTDGAKSVAPEPDRAIEAPIPVPSGEDRSDPQPVDQKSEAQTAAPPSTQTQSPLQVVSPMARIQDIPKSPTPGVTITGISGASPLAAARSISLPYNSVEQSMIKRLRAKPAGGL